jgi:hypothetical protein
MSSSHTAAVRSLPTFIVPIVLCQSAEAADHNYCAGAQVPSSSATVPSGQGATPFFAFFGSPWLACWRYLCKCSALDQGLALRRIRLVAAVNLGGRSCGFNCRERLNYRVLVRGPSRD